MKKISIIMIISVLTMCFIGLTGCSKPKEMELKSTSIVLGAHNNFPQIPYNTNSLYTSVYDAAYSWGNVSAVVVDGNPTVQCNYNIQNPGKNINEAKKKQLAKSNASTILSNISQVKATVPEIDTLKAIQLSADTLNTISEGSKSLLVFDSGLSTTGILDFSKQNILDCPPEVIIEQLKTMHAVPCLSGIDVTWVGLGQVCGTQEVLPSSYKHKLQTLWNEILVAAGANSITFDTTPLPLKENDFELPNCSVVPIVADCLELNSNSLPEAIKFDENSSVKFKGDQAEFIDPTAAEDELLPIAQYLCSNPNECIYILGMTATVTGSNYGKELSMQRAEACKKLLLNNGVKETQLICIGLGQTPNPLRVDDTNEQGIQIEEMARLNRAVFFIKNDSQLVEKIIKPYLINTTI